MVAMVYNCSTMITHKNGNYTHRDRLEEHWTVIVKTNL